jgi:hypothetical protein
MKLQHNAEQELLELEKSSAKLEKAYEALITESARIRTLGPRTGALVDQTIRHHDGKANEAAITARARIRALGLRTSSLVPKTIRHHDKKAC